MSRRHISADPNAAAEACALHIARILEEALSGQDYASFAVSGGSTPKLLFQHLLTARLEWDRIHIFWVDERAVPPDHPQSNYKLANDFLIGPARIPARNIHRVQTELSPELAAARYAAEIRDFFGLAEGELPRFDVIQQGMGPDAHTASLFPGEPLIEDREKIAVAVYVEKMHSWRITLLAGVLLAAKHNVFLVTGEDKAQAVHEVFEGEYAPMLYPAQIVAHHGRQVSWFLDRPAARLIATT